MYRLFTVISDSNFWS